MKKALFSLLVLLSLTACDLKDIKSFEGHYTLKGGSPCSSYMDLKIFPEGNTVTVDSEKGQYLYSLDAETSLDRSPSYQEVRAFIEGKDLVIKTRIHSPVLDGFNNFVRMEVGSWSEAARFTFERTATEDKVTIIDREESKVCEYSKAL